MKMKKFFCLAILLLGIILTVPAQGLRHSVCIVEPEYTSDEKNTIADYALYMARAGMKNAARTLTAYKSDGVFGSGVLVEQNGKKMVLTNLHVVGYAQAATIRFQLHDKTIRYPHCHIIAIAENCDLVLLEVPAESEMIPLKLSDMEIIDEMEVVAAGFPELADKPSWQLTRGFVSNARLENAEKKPAYIIQHTASIDPGSSGGPLLYKNEEGKYNIIGINTWKAFYRDGVGLAIGEEDIRAFLQNSEKAKSDNHNELAKMRSTTGEDWLYVFRQLPDSTQKQLREMDWQLPLDQALRTLAIRDSLVSSRGKKAKHYERSATHVVTEMDHGYEVRLIYDNYFGINQQAGIQFGYDLKGFVTAGLQVSALVASVMTRSELNGAQTGYENRVGAMIGAYLGAQVPIQVNKYILAPCIVQSAAAGPMKTGNINGGFAIITDTRVGLDWRIPYPTCDLILGLHYDMNWLWTKDELQMTKTQTAFGSKKFNQYLQHGLGISFGVAF